MKFLLIGIFFVDLKALFNSSLFKVIHLMSARFTCKLFRFLVFCAEGNKQPILRIFLYFIFPLEVCFNLRTFL